MDMDKLVPDAGNLTGFIEQFEVFAGAPGGVDKLREMILKLAVAGKLHDQDKTVNSVTLLESLRSQKTELIKSKKIRRGKALPEVKEGLFEIPKHWVWACLGEWGDWGSGATPSRSISAYYGGAIPWFKSGELTGGIIKVSNETITESAVEKSAVKLCTVGDVLLAMYGATIGKTAILGVEATTNQAVCSCTCFEGVDNNFLLLLLKSFNSYFIGQGAGGAQPNISREKIINTPAPLPPLEEQKRIVAKVDELMALCDKLEIQQQQQANNVLRANTAAINALLNPADPKSSFEQNWQRIAHHFNTLYGCTLPMPKGEGRKKKHLVGLENVKALKAAIKQLGIMGTLTEPSSIEGLAVTELNVIKKEIAELYKKRDIKKPKKINNCDELKSFSIPKSWEWIQLGEVCHHVADGPHFSPKYVDDGTGVLFLSGRNIKESGIDFNTAKHVSKSDHLEFCKRVEPKNGDILYTKGGTTGVATVNRTNEKFSVWVHVAVLQFSQDKVYPEYIAMALNSPHCYSQSQLYTHGIGNKDLGLTRMVNITLPFPPYEEQKRIIAKVDQLMTLCDQLEQQLTQSYSDAEKLMQATVKALVA